MSDRPLLIGQAPGPNTRTDLPLFPYPATSAGGRLKALMGLSLLEYLRTFDRINLLREFPGKDSQGEDRFPRREARAAAEALKPLLGGRRVVLVGQNVASAFGQGGLGYHDWRETRVRVRHEYTPELWHLCFARLAVVPHTSGRNRWYNDPRNREQAIAFWRDFLGDGSK